MKISKAAVAIRAFTGALLLLSTLSADAKDGINLLLINSGFEEEPKLMLQHGVSEEFPGWILENTAYSVHNVSKDASAPEGNYVYTLQMGGVLETAPDSRASAEPGKIYHLSFSSRKIKIHHPDANIGVQFSLVFFDADGKKISAQKGEEAQKGGVTEWEVLKMQATAPEGAVKVGARVVVSRGNLPKADTANFRFDNFSITASVP